MARSDLLFHPGDYSRDEWLRLFTTVRGEPRAIAVSHPHDVSLGDWLDTYEHIASSYANNRERHWSLTDADMTKLREFVAMGERAAKRKAELDAALPTGLVRPVAPKIRRGPKAGRAAT
jgi:hypothetical protein